jgi:hypothetical protein
VCLADVVRLEFQTPSGVKVIPDDAVIKHGQPNTEVLLQALPDAALGARTLTITGTPQTGKSVTLQLPVEVSEP